MSILSGVTFTDAMRFARDYFRVAWRKVGALGFLLILGTVFVIIVLSAGGNRPYFPVAIKDMPTNKHTHVEVTGKVTYRDTHEDDGDEHMRAEDDAGNFVIWECIPTMPAMLATCKKVKVGQTCTVRGISRFDGEHKWYEVHPVEQIWCK